MYMIHMPNNMMQTAIGMILLCCKMRDESKVQVDDKEGDGRDERGGRGREDRLILWGYKRNH